MAARSRGPPRPTTKRDKRTREIWRRGQPRARLGAGRRVLGESGDGVVAARDRGRIGQRRRQPLRQKRASPRRSRCDRCNVQQRAAPFAGERAHQFEIGAGCLVDRHGGAARSRATAATAAGAAELRALDVGDAGRGGGQFKPASACRRPRWWRPQKKDVSRRSAVAPSNTSRVSGITAGSPSPQRLSGRRRRRAHPK